MSAIERVTRRVRRGWLASPPASPLATSAGERNTALDAVRGVAVLGMLTMNAVAFGLPAAAYNNLNAAGSRAPVDWIIGAAGEVFADQKFMGLFSILFGAGVVLFAERAAAKGRRCVLLSLWRNALLAAMGIAHAAVWEGNVLLLYGLCSPVVLALRRLPPKLLLALGGACFAAVAVTSWAVQSSLDSSSSLLIEFWHHGAISGITEVWFSVDVFGRALGAMLIGAALYRTGVIGGSRAPGFYRRLAAWGLGIGLPLSAAGLALVAGSGFDVDWAIAGTIPNTLATVPVCLGYIGLVTLWNRAAGSALRRRIRATGRMALTNYLAQTAFGIAVLESLSGNSEPGRSAIALFVVAVWAVQLWWSKAWLDRFAFGPVEWLWRCATYRRWQPIRHR
ncbi:DUF418 domain-containing protein [Candidatus Poriferisodalis sp.]|uniref:DUF418 domain-containing protein n=1 Tax=Candidatus Poriferisodalis sp. TaxID=3101277 RepID=UPI003B01540A